MLTAVYGTDLLWWLPALHATNPQWPLKIHINWEAENLFVEYVLPSCKQPWKGPEVTGGSNIPRPGFSIHVRKEFIQWSYPWRAHVSTCPMHACHSFYSPILRSSIIILFFFSFRISTLHQKYSVQWEKISHFSILQPYRVGDFFNFYLISDFLLI